MAEIKIIGETTVEPRDLPKLTDLEKEFTVSKEERAEILSETQKEFEEEGKVFALFPGTEADKIIAEKNLKLVQDKVNKNVQYVSDVSGLPITNEGLQFKDWWASLSLGRSETFSARKKRFLNIFPEGEYLRVSAPISADEDKFYEVFKTDKSEDNYRLIDPIGTEWDPGDLEQLSDLGNFAVAGEIALYLTGKKKGKPSPGMINTIKSLLTSDAARIYFGNLTGRQVDKLVDDIAGYGEFEFAGEEEGALGKAESFLKGYLNINDQLGAATSAGIYKAIDVGTNIIAGTARPGLIPEADLIAHITEKYGLDPVVAGQLLSNPLLRDTWFQTTRFSSLSDDVIEGQIQSSKELLESLAKGEKLDIGTIMDTQAKLEQAYAAKISKLLGSNNATEASVSKELQEVLKSWNTISQKLEQNLIRDVAGYSAGDSGVKISGVQKAGTQELNNILAKSPGKSKKIILEDGTEQTVKTTTVGGKVYDAEVNKLESIVSRFNKLEPTLNFTSEKKAQQYLKTLVNFRKELFDLQYSPNQEVAASASRLHKLISDRFNPSKSGNFGNESFIENLQFLDAQLIGNENVRGVNFIKEALVTKGNDIVGFAEQFIKPGTTKIITLKNMLDESAPEVGNEAFESIRKVWLSNLLRDPAKVSATLAEWQARDPDGLKLLLGDTSFETLEQIAKEGLKVNSSSYKKLLDDQGTVRELVFDVIKKAKGEKIGTERAVDDLILQNAGSDINHPFMVSARAGLIEDILNKASKTNSKTGTQTLDMKKVEKGVQELLNNPNLMKFFDDASKGTLEDLNKYVNIIAQSDDVGAVLAAGEVRQKLIQGIFSPKDIVGVGLTIFKNNLVARLLSSPVTSKLFKEVSAETLNTNKADFVKLLLTEGLKEVKFDPDQIEQEGPNVIGETTIFDEAQASAQIPVQIPTTAVPGSAVSSAQVVAPLPTIGQQGAPMNVARAQQAFPFDPIFAAGGGSIDKQGIMNTSRGRQMVV